jgi:predicted transcriptional regulator
MVVMAMEKTTLYLTPELLRMLQDVSRRKRRPQAELVREALQQYLERQERQLPRSIGIAASGKIDATETEAWLEEHWRPG